MIQIGDYTFPSGQAQALIRREEVHARIRKSIRIDALLGPFNSLDEARSDVEDLEGELAKIDTGLADVRIQDGRYYLARRREYSRTLDERTITAAIHLTVLTEDPFERSVTIHNLPWNIAGSGAQMTLVQTGNVPAPPVMALIAMNTLINPSLSDGYRNWTFVGSLNAGEYLVIDSDHKTVLRNGIENNLHCVSGDFVQLVPGNTLLTYTDHPNSTHQSYINIQYQDRWD